MRGKLAHRYERKVLRRENRVRVDAHAVQRGLVIQPALVIERRVLAVGDEILAGVAKYLSRGAALGDVLAVVQVELFALAEHQPHIAVVLLRRRRAEAIVRLVGKCRGGQQAQRHDER